MHDLLTEDFLSLDLPLLVAPTAAASVSPASQNSAETGEKYLVFRAGSERFYGVAARRVVEAAPSLVLTTVPNAPQWLLGIANLRGEIISVINLAAILGEKFAKPAPRSRFIVLRSEIFSGGAAFAADKINEIVSLPSNRIQLNQDAGSPHLYGQAVYQSQILNLLDTEKMLAALVV